MAVGESTNRLFCIRIYPESAPHAIVAVLAASASEAEKVARGKTLLADAPASVFEVPEGEAMLVTFR